MQPPETPPPTSKTLFWDDEQTPAGRVLAAGYHLNVTSMTFRPMRVLGSYTLSYIVAGRGVYRDVIRNRRYKLQAGDLTVLFPEVAHSYAPAAGEAWSEFFIIFDGPVFDFWRSMGLLDAENPLFHLEPIDKWQARFEALATAPRPTTSNERILEVCSFLQMLTEILTSRPFHRVSPYRTREVSQACSILETNLSYDLHMHDVAQQVGLSFETFRKRFRHEVGVPPVRYRMQKRMNAACAMLEHSDMTNQEIALRLGLPDKYYFSRRFKEIIGMAPAEYRSRLVQRGSDGSLPEGSLEE